VHNTHSAVFAEVKVDEELGVIRVTRVVTRWRPPHPEYQDPASRSWAAWCGASAWPLHEETLLDHTFRPHHESNIAEYHVPVNADVHRIKVIFVRRA